MRTTLIRLAVLLTAALPAIGCSRAIGEASGLVFGAKGTYMPIQPLAADKKEKTLGTYSRFELGTISDDIGNKTPPDLVTYLTKYFPEQVRKANLPDNDTGKTLVVRGKIIYYESASTVGYVLGPLEEVICRTELVDKSSGQVLGVADCVGRTTATSDSGVKSKASGLAKAFVRWIDARYPSDMKKK